MKRILIFGRLSQRLAERLSKLGYKIVDQPHNLLDLGEQTHRVLSGKVDVIIYHVCSCCRDQFEQFSKLAYCGNPEWTVPVIIVRGGDFIGQGYMIQRAIWEFTATDEDFKLAIDSAAKMAEEFKAKGTA